MSNFEPITRVESTVIVLPQENIDTDQIIPAQYLKTTTRNGLGEKLFYNWRFDQENKPNPNFIFNTEFGRQSKILVTGDNFGCGSSREHAPWALYDYGIRIIISTSFADIFSANARKNGILLIQTKDKEFHQLSQFLGQNKESPITVDLENQTIEYNQGTQITFDQDPFVKHCLINGLDQFDYLIENLPLVISYENQFNK